MKSIRLFFAASLLLAGSAYAEAQTFQDDSIGASSYQYHSADPLTPTYLDYAVGGLSFWSNWFLSVQGGEAAFIGKPLGCSDFFGRTKPLLSIGLGKWFNPHIGARLAFDGFKFLDYSMTSRTYQNLHLDLMYNLLNGYKYDKDGLGRWGLIPFAGVGIINNSYAQKNPCTLSYGLICQYRFTKRLMLSGELGATTTFQDFDGVGNSRRLGDHLLRGSLGLTVLIGQPGWKRVIDPMPYVYQNDWLQGYVCQLKDKNEVLERKMAKDKAAMNEMKKILEIKGLLEAINDSTVTKRFYPKNNYSGLNALRARMKGSGLAQTDSQPIPTNPADSTGQNEYIGVPVNFFFKLNTAELTSKAQHLNIAEIAKVAKKHNLYVRIVGAADKATGTEERNKRLSESRASYIAGQLEKRGVPKEQMVLEALGDISRFKPEEINRYTRVMLYHSLP